MSKSTITVPGDPTNVAVMAAIGHVCLQWSRLEMAVHGLLITIEPMEWEKGAIIFGGLDLQPRVNLAIQLARYHKIPVRLIKRIEEIRSALQKGGLADRRNQVVHGAHRDMADSGTTLTMLRWKGDRRSQTLSAQEISEIANEAYALGDVAWQLMDDIRGWYENRFAEA